MATIFTLITIVIIALSAVGGFIFFVSFFRYLFGSGDAGLRKEARGMVYKWSTLSVDELRHIKEKMLSSPARNSAGGKVTIAAVDFLLCGTPITKESVRAFGDKAVQIRREHDAQASPETK